MAAPNIFNVNWYLQQNPDIAAAVNAGLIDAQTHFNLYGRFEDRSPSPLFDPASYLESNPDIAEAVSAGLINAYDHFVNFGINEGRNPTPLFDPQFYLQQNPDVAQAMGNTPAAAVQHFLNWGVNEPRAINPAIHLGAYLQSNPDVAEAARFSLITAFDHFATFGITEPRDLGNGVNLNTFGNDPSFQAALSQGQLLQAITRVQEVAPFLPTFQSPPGWEPPPTLPIPLDFVPPQGTQLVIPSGVIVPEGVVLPDVFDPVPLPPVPGNPGGGTSVAFLINENADHGPVIISFGGTATGDITMEIDDAGSAAFMRGTTPGDKVIDDIKIKSISLKEGQNLRVTHEQFRDIKIQTDQGSIEVEGNIDGRDLAEHQSTPLPDLTGTIVLVGEEGIDVSMHNYLGGVLTVLGGDGGNTITGSRGNDIVNAADGNDIVKAGYGKDTVEGGNGDDVFVIVGSVAENQYVASDIPDELKAVVTLDSFSRHETSEAEAGESYDGGEGTDTLHIFGTVDMSGLTLTGIENIVVHSDVTFSAAQMKNFASIIGDGGSTVRVSEGGGNVDLSGIEMSNIGQLDVGNGVTATMSEDNLSAVQTVSSGFTNSKIQAAANATLNFAGKNLFGGASIVDDSDQEIPLESATDLGGIIDGINDGIIKPTNALLGLANSDQSYDVNGDPTSSADAPLESYWQSLAIKTQYELMCDDLAGGAVLMGRSISGLQNFISGGAGNDTIIGAIGTTNFIYGGSSGSGDNQNTITGGSARDFIAGGDKKDFIRGGAADDFIAGDAGVEPGGQAGDVDMIRGETGNDFINTGAGADRIIFERSEALNGADFIDGTSLVAGTNGDVFDFSLANENYSLHSIVEPVEALEIFLSANRSDSNNEISGLSDLRAQPVIVLSNIYGFGDSLKSVLDTPLDGIETGNRIIAWKIAETVVGLGVLENPSVNDDLEIHTFAIIGGFDVGEEDDYLADLTVENFDVIGLASDYPDLYYTDEG